ncbi:MAG: hypothetical protein E6422_07300 [Veillonella sp.]|uniref:hypothetical protein n=1 Tax=Veillonella sp. TaxID=1926307 RepID=UPI00290A5EA4|nr:hypothetical protein [Veillonella sp.]MDU6787933.1 hypothetical protein [Veillonella sp.]
MKINYEDMITLIALASALIMKVRYMKVMETLLVYQVVLMMQAVFLMERIN